MVRLGVVLFGSALLLAACGTATEDRALGGAGIGAAGGAIVGAVTGLTVIEGAALGAIGGALTGALSDPAKLNLGQPVWRGANLGSRKNEEVAWDAAPAGKSSGTAARHSALVERIQAGLLNRGYDPGPIDGVMGPRTDTAIRDYQRDRGLLTDGRPSRELAAHIELAAN